MQKRFFDHQPQIPWGLPLKRRILLSGKLLGVAQGGLARPQFYGREGVMLKRFNAVEWLVVVAIVAVLFALIMPSVRQYQLQERRQQLAEFRRAQPEMISPAPRAWKTVRPFATTQIQPEALVEPRAGLKIAVYGEDGDLLGHWVFEPVERRLDEDRLFAGDSVTLQTL